MSIHSQRPQMPAGYQNDLNRVRSWVDSSKQLSGSLDVLDFELPSTLLIR